VSAPLPAADWQVRLVKPRLGGLAAAKGLAGANGPAEVSDLLCETLLDRQNVLEDAEYNKTVPNEFVVELPPDSYARHYAPLSKVIEQQWRERLLNYLATANSRQGRREYRFAGQVAVEIRSAPDLEPGQLRIRSRMRAEALDSPPLAAPPPVAKPPVVLPACLELLPAGKQWQLRSGLITIGREPACDVFLDMFRVQELRLVSGQHAYLHCLPGAYRLFDGAPNGLPSINGTFVNGRPVPPGGQLLQDGDILILAAVRPQAPSLDTPGVAGLRFRALCA
jgi:FHA domain/Protein of unknown function (DUF3662)